MATTIEQARAHQRRLEEERTKMQLERRERLTEPLARAAELLRDRYGADDVILFGSLANSDLSGEIDVDIAVSALDGRHYFDALADLMELFAAPVDLVRLEEASPSLRERIDEDGQRL